MVKVGDVVTYSDRERVEQPALVQTVHGPADARPALNLVLISKDEKKTDPYGRQTEHETSVVHETNQSAGGFFWRERA